ncbi:hypothetical protein, partial [Microbacterium terrae]
MAAKKKWITYGVAGALGLTLVGGAAAATAATMNLQTADGVVPGGPLIGPGKDVLDRTSLQLRVTDTSASIVTAPSAAPSPTASVPSATSAPAASAASAPAQGSAPSIASPVTPVSPASPVSAVSAPTPVPPP